MSVAFSTSPALKHPGKFDDRTYTISNSKKKQSASNSPRRKLQSQQSTQSTQNSQHNQQTSGNPSVSVQPNQTASGRGPMRRRNSNDNLNYRKGNEVKPFKYRKQEDYENSRDPPSPTLSVSSSSGYNVSNNSSMTSNHSSRVHHSPESRTIGKYSAHDLHSLRYQMRNNEATRKMQLTARLIPNKSYTKQEIESLRMALSGIDNENAKNYYNVPPYSSYNSYQNQNYGYNQNRYSQNGMQQQRQYPRPGYYFHGQNPQQYHRDDERVQICNCPMSNPPIYVHHLHHRLYCYNCRLPIKVNPGPYNDNLRKNKSEMYQRYPSNSAMNQKPVIVAKARWQENRKHDDNMHKDQRDFREDRRPVNRITSGNLVYINSNMNYNRPLASSVSPTPTSSSKSSSPPLEPSHHHDNMHKYKTLDHSVSNLPSEYEAKKNLRNSMPNLPISHNASTHVIHHMTPMKPTLNIPPPSVNPSQEDLVNFRVPPPSTSNNVRLWINSSLSPPVGTYDQQHQTFQGGLVYQPEDQNFLKRRPPALPAGRVSPNVYQAVIPVSPVHFQPAQVLQPPPRKTGYYHSDVMYFTPYDRFLQRSHLVEIREPPEELLNKSRWDNLSKNVWKKYVEHQQTEETYRNKLMMWKQLFVMVKKAHPKCGLYMVGSTISGFGADSSDVDMCLVSRGPYPMEQREEALLTLNDLKNYIINVSSEFQQFTLIQAKVPILRFRDHTNKYEVDLNFNNCVGIRNTHLLNCYSQMDWRLKPLALVVKLWAHHHNINDARNMTISSYSLVLMVIHFMQFAVSPAILPCLHQSYPEKFSPNQDISCIDMMEELEPAHTNNRQTLGELFCQFLEYFSRFDYSTHAMSIRVGGLLPVDQCRNAKSPKNDPNHWRTLCIEEPFDLTNTARSTYDSVVFEKIKMVFQASSEIIRDTHQLDDLFVQPLFKPALSPALSFTSLVGKYGEPTK